MTKLGVNIDHSATLREARYREVPADSKIVVEPNPLQIALAAERGGADSITAHLREDRRHMRDADIFALRENISTKLNLEMSCTDEILAVAVRVKPDYVCLVSENRREVTTEGGLDVENNFEKIVRCVDSLSAVGAKCSIFIDPDVRQIELAAKAGAPMVELHTGAYANAWGNRVALENELARICAAAKRAAELSLTVNSGHGINYMNIGALLKTADFNELNIGHSIVSRALVVGMENAVREMKSFIVQYAA